MSWLNSLATFESQCNTQWLSLVALGGKRHSEVSHVLGGGPRQRSPCKTQLDLAVDRVLAESALTVPCPAACCCRPRAVDRQYRGMRLCFQVESLSLFSLLTPSLSLNAGATPMASCAFCAESYHSFVVKNCLLLLFSHVWLCM